jgi:hypothetical protein
MKIIENKLFSPRSRGFLPLITVWLEVRVLLRPPRRRTEAFAMPTRDCLRSDDSYGIKDARIAKIEPNEQRAIRSGQIWSRGVLPRIRCYFLIRKSHDKAHYPN